MLYKVTDNWGHTLLSEGGSNNVITGHRTEINCFSLVDAFDNVGIRRCAFLKFNIKGAEFDLFENAAKEILRRINCMVGEYTMILEGMIQRG